MSHQTDHEAENLDSDHEMDDFNADKQAKDEDHEWAQNQYLTPDPSVFEEFLTYSDHIPIQTQVDSIGSDSIDSEGVGAEQTSLSKGANSVTGMEQTSQRSLGKGGILVTAPPRENTPTADIKPAILG